MHPAWRRCRKGEEKGLKSSLSSASCTRQKRCIFVICPPRRSDILQFAVHKPAGALFLRYQLNNSVLINRYLRKLHPSETLSKVAGSKTMSWPLSNLDVSGPKSMVSVDCVLFPLNHCLPSWKRKHFWDLSVKSSLLDWGLNWELVSLWDNTSSVSEVTHPNGRNSGWWQFNYAMLSILWAAHALLLTLDLWILTLFSFLWNVHNAFHNIGVRIK